MEEAGCERMEEAGSTRIASRWRSVEEEEDLQNHKGAIAPLYIGMVRVGQHRSHTFRKSVFPWQ